MVGLREGDFLGIEEGDFNHEWGGDGERGRLMKDDLGKGMGVLVCARDFVG